MVSSYFSNLVQNLSKKMNPVRNHNSKISEDSKNKKSPNLIISNGVKLIYIANARIPTEKAHGIQIMKMCEAFSRYNANDTNFYANAVNIADKIEVELVVPKRFNWIKEDPFKYYEIARSFKIKKLPCLDLIPLDKYIGHLGLWIESITFFISTLFYTLFKKADILYTRNFSLLPLTLFKKNLFFEAHTFPKNYFLYFPFLKRLRGIIVITKKLKAFFVEKGIPQNKILVAPDSVDLEKFDIPEIKEACRKKINLPLNKKIVLYTGHLYEWKGADILAKASQYLPEDVEIYFVGGTEKDVEKFKVQSSNFKVNIVDQRPHSEIPYWLKAADILVLPNTAKENISKYWTSPIKMFEYMASKRPIVASDLPSIREILNENNSILVKPDLPEDLARGIKKILKDKNLAEKISNQAFRDVQNYTWQKRARNILRFIFQQTHPIK